VLQSRWGFVAVTDVWELEDGLEARVCETFDEARSAAIDGYGQERTFLVYAVSVRS
jgi:hypothetical protein